MEATELAEIEAFRDLFAACPEDLALAHGVRAISLGDALAFRIVSLSGVGEVNHALGLASAEQVDEVRAFNGETEHIVSTDPAAELDDALRERGYEAGYAWMKFRRGADAPPEARSDLRIVEVDAGAGDDFGFAFTGGYGLPDFFRSWFARLPARAGWNCFVDYDGQAPVAAGAVHVHEDIGWLGIGATVPSHRGRGAQNAILAARIARGAEAGCSVLVTETGERVPERPSRSYRNIVRSGFEPAYLRANHRSPTAAAAPAP